MSWKRLAAAAALAGLLCGSGAAAAAEAPPGGTRLGGYYVQPAVDLLKHLGIISGDPDGNLRLEDTITRSELAKIVVAAAAQSGAAQAALNEPPAFPDVRGHWARGYVAVAKRLGIVGGYGDGSFRPANPVTNAEAVTMLLRGAGLKPAGPWPQTYLDEARRAKVLTDALGTALPPDDRATRGAVFLLAERVFTLVADASGRNLLQRHFGTALKLTIEAPAVQAGVTTQPRVTLAVRAPGAMLVQVNGRPASGRQGYFTADVPLSIGVNEVIVVAVDGAGQRAQERMVIMRK